MAVYRGIVKGNVIVLDEPADLPDGAVVEVRSMFPPPATPEEREREAAFSRRLLELGLISSIPAREPDPPGLDRTPVRVAGKPVSETIIEERR
jgi:hypothetical protein